MISFPLIYQYRVLRNLLSTLYSWKLPHYKDAKLLLKQNSCSFVHFCNVCVPEFGHKIAHLYFFVWNFEFFFLNFFSCGWASLYLPLFVCVCVLCVRHSRFQKFLQIFWNPWFNFLSHLENILIFFSVSLSLPNAEEPMWFSAAVLL